MPPSTTPVNRRQQRLEAEWKLLQDVNRDSDFVYAEPAELLPGRMHEKYRITFRCRGIVSVDEARDPVFGTAHRALMTCPAIFPSVAPEIVWETPIWHPNIEHNGEKRVCINKAEWVGGVSLADVCQQMFEMVQYRNYHADAGSPPYPIDMQAAAWVREVGEPRGIVDKRRGIFVDNVPFFRPKPKPTTNIRFHTDQNGEGIPVANTHSATLVPQRLSCLQCQAEAPAGSRFCTECGQELSPAGGRVRFG